MMKRWLYKWGALCFLPLLLALSACKNSDDIDGIFLQRVWYVNLMFEEDGRTVGFTEAERTAISQSPKAYNIIFGENTFTVKCASSTFGGSWVVDGKNNTIGFTFTNSSQPADPVGKKVYGVLKEAVRYEGNYNYLRIFTKSGVSILFAPNNE